MYVETSCTASFAWMVLKLGVSMGVTYLAVQVEISFLYQSKVTYNRENEGALTIAVLFLQAVNRNDLKGNVL